MNRLYFLILGIAFLSSCDKISQQDCPLTDTDEGLIERTYFQNAGDSCFYESLSPESFSDGLVIQSEEVYDSVIVLIGLNGEVCPKEDIDFSTLTLLGQQTKGSGCRRSFKRSVNKNENDYAYEIIIRECGGCEPLVINWHWVSIPKIDNASTVSFRSKTERFGN